MYTDLITKVKNAAALNKNKVIISFSKMDMAIAEILVKRGFLKEAEKKGRSKKYIEMKLGPSIRGVRILSSPSRHLYSSFKTLRPVKSGYGIGVISTSRGIMTTEDARKQKIGGELLFEVW